MSKKNLGRTVIEGGRTGEYKAVRDQTNRAERHGFKRYLNEVTKDVDLYDGAETEPLSMEPINRHHAIDDKFADKLRPAARYLKSHVGKKWDKTYSKLRETFDDRTTSGRHILFDHLLQGVSQANDDHRWFNDLVVDEHGILRDYRSKRDRYWASKYPSKGEVENACKFLKGRKMAEFPNGDLYWFVASERNDVFTGTLIHYSTSIRYLYKTPLGDTPFVYEGGFRQGLKLTDKEKGQFMTLNRVLREKILSSSPLAKKDKKAA